VSQRTRRNPDANFRALRLMMEAVARKRAADFPAKSGYYASIEELVLDLGRRWRWQPLRREFSPHSRWGAPKACFSNALIAGLLNPDLRYVEGFAYAGLIPIHHAWNVDAKGVVVDFTWPEDELSPRKGRAYMGVVAPLEAAWKAAWEQETTVLDPPRRPWPTQDRPVRPEPDRILEMLGVAAGRDLPDTIKQQLKSVPTEGISHGS